MSTASPADEPFDLSRRLTGRNLYFDATGAVLEATPAATPAIVAAWRRYVATARAALGWPDGPIAARQHAHGVSLALAAPVDQLYTATEVNEWALWKALLQGGSPLAPPQAPGWPAAWDDTSALATLRALAQAESEPALARLVEAASAHGLDTLIDDDQVTLGGGKHGKSWPRGQLPAPGAVPWATLADVPTALITGSNGKTTTARLLAALARAHGWRAAHSSTDGVFVGARAIDRGDYSGPGGARLALRQPDVDAVVLETARGGILRRGLATSRADVAVVTNVSEDHFGEYGIDTLDDLAVAKLTVAHVLGERGTLVLNGADERLLRHAAQLPGRRSLFALDADAPALRAAREQGHATCGVRAEHLLVEGAGAPIDLGEVRAMPLTFDGAARYNVANIAAAVLAAHALGIVPETLRRVLAAFGSARGDNPGRLEHFTVGGLEVFMDFAHNPDGLHGLLEVAAHGRHGPLWLLLGQAGDRSDADIRALAAVAAAARPDHVVIKELVDYMRGRAAGEVPAVLRAALVDGGIPPGRIDSAPDEYAGVIRALATAPSGTTVVLPVHVNTNRTRVETLLDRLADCGWMAGTPLPAWTMAGQDA